MVGVAEEPKMVERGPLAVDHVIKIRGLDIQDVTQRIDARRIGYIGESLGSSSCAVAHLRFITRPSHRDGGI